MKNYIAPRIFLLCLTSAFTAADAIEVSDSKNSRLYKAPQNPRSKSGLSSYILRGPSLRYFTGSSKPIWDEEPVNPYSNLKYTVECTPYAPCSQTIPLWSNNEEFEDRRDNHVQQVHYDEAKSTQRPRTRPNIKTTATASTLGLSVASLYSNQANPKWPSTYNNRVTTEAPRPFVTYDQAEEALPSFYSNVLTDRVDSERYDPFNYHHEKRKLRRPSRTSYTTKEEPVRPSHNTDSRFGVTTAYGPKIIKRHNQQDEEELVVPNGLRDTITWRHQRQPPMHQYHQGYGSWNYNNRDNNYNNVRRAGYNYREDTTTTRKSITRKNPYFPGGTTFTANDDQIPAYNDQTAKPERDYFPVTNNEKNQFNDRNDYYSEPDRFFAAANEPFVGKEQLVNAGYVVQESDNPGDDKYTYRPDLSKWYDIKPTHNVRPKIPASVKPWVSLDLAKPSWEDSNNDSQNNEELKRMPNTYGSWNKDTLKLGAIPFSRAADGKERASSTVRKRKKLDTKNNMNAKAGLRLVKRRKN